MPSQADWLYADCISFVLPSDSLALYFVCLSRQNTALGHAGQSRPSQSGISHTCIRRPLPLSKGPARARLLANRSSPTRCVQSQQHVPMVAPASPLIRQSSLLPSCKQGGAPAASAPQCRPRPPKQRHAGARQFLPRATRHHAGAMPSRNQCDGRWRLSLLRLRRGDVSFPAEVGWLQSFVQPSRRMAACVSCCRSQCPGSRNGFTWQLLRARPKIAVVWQCQPCLER